MAQFNTIQQEEDCLPQQIPSGNVPTKTYQHSNPVSRSSSPLSATISSIQPTAQDDTLEEYVIKYVEENSDTGEDSVLTV